MPLLVPNAAEVELLTRILESFGTGEELKLNLYKNDYTPADGMVPADFTDADFTGYSETTIDPGEWTISSVSNQAKAVYGSSPLSWTCTGGGHTVYGYYVTDNDGTNVMWAEKFLNSKVIATDDTPQLQPTFSLRTDE